LRKVGKPVEILTGYLLTRDAECDHNTILLRVQIYIPTISKSKSKFGLGPLAISDSELDF